MQTTSPMLAAKFVAALWSAGAFFLVAFYTSNLRADIIQPIYLPEINNDADAIKYLPKVHYHSYFDEDTPNYEEEFNELFIDVDPRLREKVLKANN